MEPWQLQPARDLGLPAPERWRCLQRESGLVESGLRLVWLAATRLFFAGWNRLEVRGRERLPAGPPFLLIANHSSHLDALLLAAALPLKWRDRVSPLAAGDVFFERRPLAAFAAAVLNALPVWRRRRSGGAHSLDELRRRLSEQAGIYIVFPEGTRSRDGQMAPFKSGLGALVAGAAVPVVPCHLQGAFAAAPPGRRFPRRRKIVLTIGAPLTFGAVANHRAGWAHIAAQAEQAVRGLAPVAAGKSEASG